MKSKLIFHYKEFLLSCILFFIFGIIELCRDAFNLPFFADRLYFLYLLSLSFIFFLYLIFASFYKKNYLIPIKKIEISIFILSILLIFIDLFKNKDQFFSPIQLLCFLFSMRLLFLLIKNIDSFTIYKLFKYFTYAITFIMIIIWFIWFFIDGSFADLKTRNSLPYILLGIYLLFNSWHY